MSQKAQPSQVTLSELKRRVREEQTEEAAEGEEGRKHKTLVFTNARVDGAAPPLNTLYCACCGAPVCLGEFALPLPEAAVVGRLPEREGEKDAKKEAREDAKEEAREEAEKVGEMKKEGEESGEKTEGKTESSLPASVSEEAPVSANGRYLPAGPREETRALRVLDVRAAGGLVKTYVQPEAVDGQFYVERGRADDGTRWVERRRLVSCSECRAPVGFYSGGAAAAAGGPLLLLGDAVVADQLKAVAVEQRLLPAAPG